MFLAELDGYLNDDNAYFFERMHIHLSESELNYCTVLQTLCFILKINKQQHNALSYYEFTALIESTKAFDQELINKFLNALEAQFDPSDFISSEILEALERQIIETALLKKEKKLSI
mgnify:FL=1